MLHGFELIPFRKYQLPVSIEGRLDIKATEITFDVQLSGNLASVNWPELDRPFKRQSGLWESTCLEFFLGPGSGKHYWEFNLAPTGHWNCFSFTDIRQDMKESQSLHLSSFFTSKTNHSARATARIENRDIDFSDLRIGISAVIAQDNKLSYYALSHGRKSPDFHARVHHLLVQ